MNSIANSVSILGEISPNGRNLGITGRRDFWLFRPSPISESGRNWTFLKKIDQFYLKIGSKLTIFEEFFNYFQSFLVPLLKRSEMT